MDETPPYCNQYHHCQVFLSNDAVEKHGWLNKQGGNLGQWRRRWFVQSNNYLFYFKSPQDTEPRGSIPLEMVEVVKQEQGGEQGIFLVHHKDNFSYYLQSEDGPEDVDEWVESIKWAKYSALKAGYFRLDDINAKLKEQVQQAEELVQHERARVAELEQQCERLRRSGGSGFDPETAANADQIEQLTERLRQTERERDQALRQGGHAGSVVNNDGCFDPTPSDFRVLVYRERYDDSNIMGELFLRPDCTFEQVRQIIAEDLGEDGPIQLVHGHLGDPMGRSGNMLGPQYDQSAIQEVFTDHDAEMLIVHPDLAARASGWRRPTTSTNAAATPAAQWDRGSTSTPAIAGASRMALDAATAPRVDDAQRGGAAVRVPVYWESNDERNRRGDLAIYQDDTVGDVRARIVSEGLSRGEEVSLKRRKVPMMPRNDSQPASKYFSSEADYIVIYK